MQRSLTWIKDGVYFMRRVLFWWQPSDWHDAFFEPTDELYLHPGDRLFLWAEGLGYQLHEFISTEPREP